MVMCVIVVVDSHGGWWLFSWGWSSWLCWIDGVGSSGGYVGEVEVVVVLTCTCGTY